jgi:hypothetical protein
MPLGSFLFPGQVDRCYAITTKLAIDDHHFQDPTPVHGAAKAEAADLCSFMASPALPVPYALV